MTELNEKMQALRAKMLEKQKAAQQEQERKIAEAQAIYAARAVAAGVGTADPLQRYAAATATGGEGTLPLPKTWFGADQAKFLEAMPEEDVKGFEERLNAMMLATGEGDIRQACGRLQSLLRDRPGLTTLLNPTIMQSFIEKMQSFRKVTYANSKAKADARAKSIDARAAGQQLVDMLGEIV